MIGIYARVEVIDCQKAAPSFASFQGLMLFLFQGFLVGSYFLKRHGSFVRSRGIFRLVTILALKWMKNHQKMWLEMEIHGFSNKYRCCKSVIYTYLKWGNQGIVVVESDLLSILYVHPKFWGQMHPIWSICLLHLGDKKTQKTLVKRGFFSFQKSWSPGVSTEG